MVKNVIVVGAGIGGLVTALCLHRRGFAVRIFESVEKITELGVGINILPHAVRVLTELGLSEELLRAGITTAELIYHNKLGQKIWQENRGLNAGYKWPQYSISRGRLHTILLDAVKQNLGESSVVPGHHLASFDSYGGGVTASFVNRKTGLGLGSYDADALIGADGIHSSVRRILYPNEGPPKWSGIMMYRGVTESLPFLTGRSMIMAGHFNQKFVAYPISANAELHGMSLVNWIAELRVGNGVLEQSDWNRHANKEDFAPVFSSWVFDWMNIPKLIEDTEKVYQFPMVDRDPLPRWSFDNVTLLGDAAHPMYPIGSNGASQAILDAEALAEDLTGERDVASALLKYQERRLAATAAVVESNRRMGPERVMQLVEERAPTGFSDLNQVITNEELRHIEQEYKMLAGFNRETLNSQYDRRPFRQ